MRVGLRLVVLLALTLLPGFGRAVLAAETITVLYDGALGTLPGAQRMLYRTLPENGAQATQSVANGKTTLDTTPNRLETAGYFGLFVPDLSRQAGLRVSFRLQVRSEAHNTPAQNNDDNSDGKADRAGLSIIVLANDKKGIEIGFWEDRIWAQEGGSGITLFTQAESASYNTLATLTIYDLRILNDTYTLSADGTPILTGPVRDYSAFSGVIDPYEIPNLIFVGDDTSSAQANIDLARVEIGVPAPDVTPTPPPTTVTPTPPPATVTPTPAPRLRVALPQITRGQ